MAGERIDIAKVTVFHITAIENLPGIIKDGKVYSDAIMAAQGPKKIGYDHIKLRRLQVIRVPCCSNRFVGEFVPFYFCPRSPMLYSINRGNTGLNPGCQGSIVHLVSKFSVAISTGQPWAVSSGNAGAMHSTFAASTQALDNLDWDAIKATQWAGRQHEKQAELLVADFFDFSNFHGIGCLNDAAKKAVDTILTGSPYKPVVKVIPGWYY